MSEPQQLQQDDEYKHLIPSNIHRIPNSNEEFHYSLRIVSSSPQEACSIALTTQSSSKRKTSCGKYLILGRQASTVDIRVDHKSISRRHALLFYSFPEKDLCVVDLGTKKGSFVNDERIDANRVRTLHADDVLVLGTCHYKFRVEASCDKNDAPQQAENDVEKSGEGENSSATGGDDVSSSANTRKDRELEIQRAIASLDTVPTYTAPKIEVEEDEDISENPSSIVEDLPVSHTFSIENSVSSKPITCIAVDASGARFLVGSYGNDTISLYDFGGMTTLTKKPFKTIQVEDGYTIISASFPLKGGDKFIVGTTSSTPVVYDRDGNALYVFAKGDPYIVDKTKTIGHVGSITSCSFHPLKKELVFTSSMDGTVRLWDLMKQKKAFGKLVCEQVFMIKDKNNKFTKVQTIALHPSGNILCIGTSCGSIQIWNFKKSSHRPERVIWNAHPSQNPIVSLVYNMRGDKLASRAMEHQELMIWDTAISIKSKFTIGGAYNRYEYANSYFDPTGEQYIIFGTEKMIKIASILEDDSQGNIIWEKEMKSDVICVLWHAQLNQFFVGCSNGVVHILYNPNLSNKGAILTTSRAVRKKDAMDLLLESRASTSALLPSGPILTPLVHGGPSAKKRKTLNDTSKLPEPPSSAGIKMGGSSSSGVNFTQFVVSHKIPSKNSTQNLSIRKDPRDHLFKYSEGKDYGTATDTVLAKKTAEEEEEEMKKRSSGRTK